MKLRVAFFQRFFAHYQSGLVKELANRSEHEYYFYGDDHDPLGSGIEPIPADLRGHVRFTVARTYQWNEHVAFQWSAVRVALFGSIDVLILEGSFTFPTNWLAILAARARGKRVLLYTHGWRRQENGIKALVRNAFYRLGNGLLLYGNRARRIGMEHGLWAERLYVAFNSLDEEIMQPWRERLSEQLCDSFRAEWLGAAASKPLLVSVGRLNVAKRYPLLLEAAARLRQQGHEVSIMIVGDGPERPLLEETASVLGVRLILTSARHDEEFLSLCLGAADLTVIPGAAGLTVIHSLSYGTPVIVHDDNDQQGPESETVLEGVNGARFHAGDAEDLARVIERVLRELPRSPRVAAQCRSVVEADYSPSRMRMVFDHAVVGRPATKLISQGK